MNKLTGLCLLAVAGAMFSCSRNEGSVTIKLPEDFKENKLVVSHVTIDNIFNATRQEDLHVYYDTLEVKSGRAILKLDASGPARYNIEPPVNAFADPDFYASPEDNLEVTINSFEPLDYKVTGSQLMEDITAVTTDTRALQLEYMESLNKLTDDSARQEAMNKMIDRYDGVIKKFVAENPDSPAIPFVITDLNSEDFQKIYENMSPKAKESILMPYAELYARQVEDMLEAKSAEEARNAEIASGTVKAADFTLPDLQGKKVSLSDFKGKWVVLDFWGSWCGWCIKGFPALKEAYEKYGNKMVVIGIDCNESEEDWHDGVKKYSLPWLNLYNGNNQDIYKAYNIEGFPTKAIINPEGYLVDLTTGEDPSFFTRLSKFIGKE